jgi:hypothetical protein
MLCSEHIVHTFLSPILPLISFSAFAMNPSSATAVKVDYKYLHNHKQKLTTKRDTNTIRGHESKVIGWWVPYITEG